MAPGQDEEGVRPVGDHHAAADGYWLIGLPAAWLCGELAGWDTVGVRLGLLAGLAATAVLLLRRYQRALSLRAVQEPTPT